jgi:hypothetical protein
MEQSPFWEINNFSASQEIPQILLNPKVHYRTHKCAPTVTTLRQLDEIYKLVIINYKFQNKKLRGKINWWVKHVHTQYRAGNVYLVTERLVLHLLYKQG